MSQNKKYPKFSVLMSVYKDEKPEYLDLALESIECQSVRPNEIILVEDGPITSGLKQIIIKHKKKFGKGFKNIVSQKNQGLGASLRLGTKYVSTDWIARMDSDDYSVPNRFELQLKIIMEQPNLAVVGGQIEEFAGTRDNIVGYRRVPTSYEEIRRFMKIRSPFNHPTVMINKKKLDKVGGYIPYGNLEDYYLWCRIVASHFEVLNLPSTLTLMRVDQGMYSRRGNIKNIRYFLKLRSYLRKNRIVNRSEEIIGDFLMSLNIIIPNSIRKKIYTSILHK